MTHPSRPNKITERETRVLAAAASMVTAFLPQKYGFPPNLDDHGRDTLEPKTRLFPTANGSIGNDVQQASINTTHFVYQLLVEKRRASAMQLMMHVLVPVGKAVVTQDVLPPELYIFDFIPKQLAVWSFG